MLTDMLSWICMLKSKHLFISSFIGFEIRKKEQAKWAKWARILKNNLTDEQLCSLICCLVFACLNIYQYICSFIAFEISKKSELSELKCSKSPLHMSSYAHWHGFLAAAPKGTKSCRIQGDFRSFVHLSVRPSVRPPLALSGLKSVY